MIFIYNFLKDKPLFSEVHQEFLDFVSGHTLLIHNAPFDVGFIDAELARCGRSGIRSFCNVVDTLVQARDLFMGQKNSYLTPQQDSELEYPNM